MFYSKKNILILLFGLFLGNFIFAQSNIKTKNNKDTNKEKNDISQKEIIKKQTIESLHYVLDDAARIPSFKYRTLIASKTADVLWNYEPEWTQLRLTQIIQNLLQEYESLLSDNKEKVKQRQIAEAVRILLKSLAQRNVASASKLQKNFLEIKEKYLNKNKEENLNLDDSLDLASSGLDKDTAQSAALVAKVIQFGISSSFPKYLFELKAKNPAVAENLYRKALFHMVQGNTYTFEHAILLASFAFNEPVMLIPVIQTSSGELKSGVFTSVLNPPDDSPNNEIIQAYLGAVLPFVNNKIQSEPTQISEAGNLAAAYFLIKKSEKYSELYQINNREVFNRTDEIVKAQLLSLGIKSQTLEEIAGYAERSALKSDVFKFATGQELIDKAETAGSDKEKQALLVRGIVRLIDEKKFDEAESLIIKVDDSEMEGKLNSFSNTQASLALIDSKQFAQAAQKINKIEDVEIKSFLFLKICEVLVKDKKNFEASTNYLREAQKNINLVDSLKVKAKGLFAVANIMFLLKQAEAISILQDAIKTVNKSEDFEESNLQIKNQIPGTGNFYSYSLNQGFEDCSINAARFDIANTQLAAEQFQKREIGLLAKIIIAKAILEK